MRIGLGENLRYEVTVKRFVRFEGSNDLWVLHGYEDMWHKLSEAQVVQYGDGDIIMPDLEVLKDKPADFDRLTAKYIEEETDKEIDFLKEETRYRCQYCYFTFVSRHAVINHLQGPKKDKRNLPRCQVRRAEGSIALSGSWSSEIPLKAKFYATVEFKL